MKELVKLYSDKNFWKQSFLLKKYGLNQNWYHYNVMWLQALFSNVANLLRTYANNSTASADSTNNMIPAMPPTVPPITATGILLALVAISERIIN